MHCHIILRCVRTTTVAVENKKSITFSEYISMTLVIQHVVRVRHIVIGFCMALHFFFSHYLLKRHELKYVFEHQTCVLIFLSGSV